MSTAENHRMGDRSDRFAGAQRAAGRTAQPLPEQSCQESAAVDPYRLSSYRPVSVRGEERVSTDEKASLFVSAGRELELSFPFSVKAGLDRRSAQRDIRNFASLHNYNGVEDASIFLDESFSQRVAPWGFPRIEWISAERTYEAYKANPEKFALNQLSEYNTRVGSSKAADEVVSAGYLRIDAQLYQNRLKLVGGVRVEQTNVSALGPLTDPTRNFQRAPDGSVIIGSNGRPVPIETSALAARELTFVERGMQAEKEYLRVFPNINASYNIADALVARAAYYVSVGRPDFNQYAGGLTSPDLESPPGPNNRIIVNNVGIKAWTAQTWSVRLEYYPKQLGQFSIGAFRREFENLFGQTVIAPAPGFLELYGLDQNVYGDYEVGTQENVAGSVTMDGLNVSYRQMLTFLPQWARGIQVFAGGSVRKMRGADIDKLTDAHNIPRSGSWGISLTRDRYNLRVNWNYRGCQKNDRVAESASIGADTYNWTAPRYSYDVLGEARLSGRVSAFANFRNANDAALVTEIYGPLTPSHARLRQTVQFGAVWTFGIKGTFCPLLTIYDGMRWRHLEKSP